MYHSPWNRAYGALLPLKKELYKAEDIKTIEEATNALLLEFMSEGIYVQVGKFNPNIVQRVEIHFETVASNNSYVDMETLQLKLIT